MNWYLQIQDADRKVLALCVLVGKYSKYNRWLERAVNCIVSTYPTATRWEVRIAPYTSKVCI